MALLTPRKRRSKASTDAEALESSLIKDTREKIKRADESGRSTWVDEAKKCDAFAASHQWEDEDEKILEEQRRPKITFNLIRRVVAAIVGTEVQHRQRILFLPRKPKKADVAAAADLATDAVDWALERAKAPHERSIAFKDTVIRGLGCVGYRLDYEEDPDGQLVIERVDSLEMYWDPDARKQNLEDARWVARKRKWRIDEVREEFGKDVGFIADDGRSYPLGPGDDGTSYTKVVNLSDTTFPSQKVTPGTPSGWRQGEVEVIEIQWWEREKYYRVLERVPKPPMMDATQAPGPVPPGAMSATPLPPPGAPPSPAPAPGQAPPFGPIGGQSTDLTMVAGGPPSPPSVAAPPGMVLPPTPQGGTPPGGPPPSPEPEFEERWVSFSTDEYDELLAKHRMMAESAIARGEEPPPPPAAVKQTRRRYKQAYIAGGTVLQEGDHWHDGFTYSFMTWDWDPKEKMWFGLVRDLIDPQKGVNKWVAQGIHHFNASSKGVLLVEPSAVVNPAALPTEWAKPNAIIHVNTGAIAGEKLQVVPPAPLPEAVGVMTQYSMQAMQQIPGVNVELLGASEGDEPGVAIQKRQAQGLTILAGLFDALTRFRETEAKSVLRILKKYLADGRLIRIGDPHDLQYRELLLEDFAEDYDLVIDDAPRSPDQKRVVWETMQTIMPLLVRQNGDLPDTLKDYMPLPASAIADLKKEAAERAAAPQPPLPKEQNPEYVAAEIALKQAQAQLALARAQSMLKQTGIGIAETAQDMVLEKKRDDREERVQDRDLKIREDENTLNAIDTLKRDQDPDFPGVRAG